MAIYSSNFLNKISTLIVFSIITMVSLLYLAYQKAWYDHLVVDFGFYYYVVNIFWHNFSFGIIPENSYFPGSLFLFLIPGTTLLFKSSNSWQLFILAFVITNIFLIFAHLFVYRKSSHSAPFIFLVILLFSGPIILFRHELFPSIVLILSLLLWKARKINLSALTLGLATSIKIFPALIFPYYLILVLKNGEKRRIINVLIFFALGILLTFSVYFILGSPPSEIAKSLNFNTTKPVHIESLWASLLTLKEQLINDVWILGRADQKGIYGLDPSFVTFSIAFFNYFWIIPMSLFYLYIYKKTPKDQELKIEITFLIILLFIIFSKIITPQYLFWFLPLFPLFDLNKNRKLLISSLITILLIVLFTQYIYPLHYTELLWKFYTNGTDTKYFYILLVRNLLLILLFLLVLKLTFKKSNL